ncbi:MAG: hypothetical protein CVU71_11635 [Deltaproteobacteria bacterium HGW-Deltaproteobacteria-6]|jgi:bacterioferritin (cytochrome b1)|nr:MAG: hypothetical protein CVU71_11635 [Deltaproteobacteria bacterium HGW-Deltaproteobacteria-6]PKN96362.1 MAG: hypothetical protein CVU43_21105 [Chloroflexi bacterium HGW-Chloroflexi-5]
MNVTDINKITKVLESMAQYELALANLYTRCAETWKEDQVFWKGLAHAEQRHAENIQKMQEIIIRKQNSFEFGRPFNIVALNTAMAGVNDNIKRVTEGAFSREKMFVIARDIEQSMLESRYAEIVKTTDIEYQTLMKDILSQTNEHKMMMQEKINDIRKIS